MESVGQKLRAARFEQGLTLDEIGARTRISIRHLQAIEKDDLTPFSSAFFYRSFVRQFAQQLKLDFKDFAGAVQAAVSTIPEPLMPGQAELESKSPKLPALHARRPRKLRWLYSLTSLMVMLVVCSGAYDAWQNSRSQLQSTISGWLASLSARVASAQPSTTPIPVRQTAAVAVRLQLSAIERTWLSTVADGIQTFNGTLEPADTQVLEGREMARIRAGNAGALSVIFNGKSIGSLGPHGQVRTVVFTRAGYRTVDAPSTPAAHLLISPFILSGE